MKKITEMQILKDLAKISSTHPDEDVMFQIVEYIFEMVAKRDFEIEKLQAELKKAKSKIESQEVLLTLQEIILETIVEEM